MTASHFHRSGVIRREILQVGFSGFLGLGMTGLLAGRAWAERAGGGKRATSSRAASRRRSR